MAASGCLLTRNGAARGAIRCAIAPYAASLRLALALAQIILAGAHGRARRCVGVEGVLGHRDHAAVLAHFEHVEPAVRTGEHPVLAFELGGDALDRALG